MVQDLKGIIYVQVSISTEERRAHWEKAQDSEERDEPEDVFDGGYTSWREKRHWKSQMLN
jgi:hypothetical protein